MNELRYDVERAMRALARLFELEGLDAYKASSMAKSLVEANMMGHNTHGVALTPWYVEAIRSGAVTKTGSYEVISDRGACIAWRGRSLPGAWLLDQAIATATSRATTYGVVTLTIAGSHHVGALATYLARITSQGFLGIITCSGPAAGGVAPYGGTQGIFTPNPIAAGIPTHNEPILVDISASITTNNRARQLAREGRRFPGEWAMDASGHPTDDPSVAVMAGGTLLPVGGLDHGHKGYGLALLVEALTQGLSGLGRNLKPKGLLMNVYLQVIDPAAFGGASEFVQETTWLADACRSNPPRPGVAHVRVPGEQGCAERRMALERGVSIAASDIERVQGLLDEHGLEWPSALRT
jgi:LDH2 family malate/lactate/ureidoglycolate dehydrogenase